MNVCWLFWGCFQVSQENNEEKVAQEAAIEKKRLDFRIDRVEEYRVSHIYKEFPEYVYAANEGINVRNRATANSSVLAKLPLGTKIQILAKDKEETLGTRTDHWYQVRIKKSGKAVEGFLFGSTLTPYSLKADWDSERF